MAKRNDINSILLIGAGPIVIGQACEFDYSGTQACKALKEEGIRVILVNSNPATIMTDPELADATYIEPIEWQVVAKIIEKEKPDAILPTMGGQTALNCALDLAKHGVLDKYNVKVIGASPDAIDKAEDRQRFDIAMKKIGLETARSGIATNMQEAYTIAEQLGFPCIIRPSFTMGGTGGGIAYCLESFTDICLRGFDLSPTHSLLIDESLIGWKEYEMEVVRDKKDNCIIVCSIENFDPMGIHTGDSITVAPAQTLTDRDYQKMRQASFAILREIGVETGGSNVQFAINPRDGRMIVIEMNPRVSRSSALASKATGFPIAKIAAKLAIGYTLDELDNDITKGKSPASFEPSIDYVVTKVPRFNFEKFPKANDRLTTQMKSVGEAMALGHNFKSSLQKALRSLEIGVNGLESQNNTSQSLEEIKEELTQAGPYRIFYVAEAFRVGLTLDEIHQLTLIDKWFLVQIQSIIQLENEIIKTDFNDISVTKFKSFKRAGFSDEQIAKLKQTDEMTIRAQRKKLQVLPVFKRVDTCAGEFSTDTAYLYSSYEDECEARVTHIKEKVIILGAGPNRIGQGIEFDYCCVHAAVALKELGFETIMINCNPETVSTDYDTADRLYFEPIILEHVLDIVEIEQPLGVIVQYGGQTPLKLAKLLKENGVNILGTQPDDIDTAEDRDLFAQIVKKLRLKQPVNDTAISLKDALVKAKEIGYPIVVRPSFVLGGRAMQTVYNDEDLQTYFNQTVSKDNSSPILLDKFLENAIEVDVDAIFDGKNLLIGGIMQHIEQAGIHSGDSACSLPPYSLSEEIQTELKEQAYQLAKALNVIGLMNIQFAIKNNEIYLIEVNPRAARTIPFVSKAIGKPLAKIAAKVMGNLSLEAQKQTDMIIPKYFSIKEVVFPFNKFLGVDPILGPEMRSTGEVMGIGKNFDDAFAKAMLGANSKLKLFSQMDRKGGSISDDDLSTDELLIKSLKSNQLCSYNDKAISTYQKKALVYVNKNDCDFVSFYRVLNLLNENHFLIDMISEEIEEKVKGTSVNHLPLTQNLNKIKIDIKEGHYDYLLISASDKDDVELTSDLRKLSLISHTHLDTTVNAALASLAAILRNPRSDVISLQKLSQLSAS